jgi:hypothetical protein
MANSTNAAASWGRKNAVHRRSEHRITFALGAAKDIQITHITRSDCAKQPNTIRRPPPQVEVFLSFWGVYVNNLSKFACLLLFSLPHPRHICLINAFSEEVIFFHDHFFNQSVYGKRTTTRIPVFIGTCTDPNAGIFYGVMMMSFTFSWSVLFPFHSFISIE